MNQWGPLGQKGDIVRHWLPSQEPHYRSKWKETNRQYAIILDDFCKSEGEAKAPSKIWFDFCKLLRQTPRTLGSCKNRRMHVFMPPSQQSNGVVKNVEKGAMSAAGKFYCKGGWYFGRRGFFLNGEG